MSTALIAGGILAVLVLALGGLVWWAYRRGRTSEQADARAGAEEIRDRMDEIDARPRGGRDGALDWLRRRSGGD